MRHVCRHTTIQNPAYIFETVNLNYQCVERLKSNYSQTARKLFLISLFVRISSQDPMIHQLFSRMFGMFFRKLFKRWHLFENFKDTL